MRTLLTTGAGLALLFVAAVRAQDAGAGDPDDEWELARPAPVDPGMPERLDGLMQNSCTFCHETIADEWAQTLHALAWQDPRYREALEGRRRPESCHGCHVPEPLHQAASFGAKPAPRTEEVQKLHFGVSCQSCHVGPNGVVLGPWGEETDAHESERSEHFVGTGSNALCLACHQTTVGPVIGIGKDFLAARSGERGMTCVGCHMAPVERSAATDDDDVPTPVRPGRSHLLQTPRDPAFLRQGFELTAERTTEGARVRVRNRAGHRVPGLRGRQLRLRAELLGADEAVLATVEHTIDDRTPIAALETLELALPVKDDGARGSGTAVRLHGDHLPPHADEPVVFLAETLSLDG